MYPSVCLSVTSQCPIKVAKPRIMQTTLYDSPWPLVFWSYQKSRRNCYRVTPNGAPSRGRVGSKGDFRPYLWNSWSS